MRLLVTGGAGFIGQHLARVLAEHELTALDLLTDQVHLNPSASAAAFPGRVVRGDVSAVETWSGLDQADAIVHLAAETGTGQSMYERDRYERVNVTGTQLAVRTAQRWEVPVVLMSSRAVYGEGGYGCVEHGATWGAACCEVATPRPSREDDPHRPVSVYGESKSRAEAAVAGVDIPATIIRPQNVIGPGQALHNPYTGVLAAFLARLREGKTLQVYGDGSQSRDLVHVEDVAALIRWCVEHPPQAGSPRVINAGTGVRTTLLDLARTSIQSSPSGESSPWRSLVELVAVHRAGDIAHACADLSRLRALGTPAPRWSSEAAIGDFMRWAWDRPGARAGAWDDALTELALHGLTRELGE